MKNQILAFLITLGVAFLMVGLFYLISVYPHQTLAVIIYGVLPLWFTITAYGLYKFVLNLLDNK